MSNPQLPPMVAYGTITGVFSKRTHLSFLALCPLTIIPMVSNAYTYPTECKWDGGDASRAKRESEELFQIFSKLTSTEGLARIWASPSGLIIEGEINHFDTISEKVRCVMQEVLGEIDFQPVPHDEALPVSFEFKETA